MTTPDDQIQTRIDELETQIHYMVSIFEQISNKPGVPDSINDIINSSLRRAKQSEPDYPPISNLRKDFSELLSKYGL